MPHPALGATFPKGKAFLIVTKLEALHIME